MLYTPASPNTQDLPPWMGGAAAPQAAAPSAPAEPASWPGRPRSASDPTRGIVAPIVPQPAPPPAAETATMAMAPPAPAPVIKVETRTTPTPRHSPASTPCDTKPPRVPSQAKAPKAAAAAAAATSAATAGSTRFPPQRANGTRQCVNCSETDTPQWRGQLCNACALWKRNRGTDRPMPLLFPVHASSRAPSESPSPTPSPSPSPSPLLKALSHTPLSPARDSRFSLARGLPADSARHLPDLHLRGHSMTPMSAPGPKHMIIRPPTLHIPMSSWRASSYAIPEKRLPRNIEWADRLPALFRLKSGIEAAEGQGIAADLLKADELQISEEDRRLSVNTTTPMSTVAAPPGKLLPGQTAQGSRQHQYLTPVSPDPASRLLAPIRPREPDTSYRYTPKRMAEDDLGVLRAPKRTAAWV